jgi:hypothetical protein
MQLIRHLNEEELAELLLESDQRELQRTLAALPEWLRSSTQQPEWFWQKQQAKIRGRIAASRRAVWQVLTASACALALLLLAVALLRGGRAPSPPIASAQTDSDQELMIAIEQDVQTSVPEALAPATLLADEIGNSQVTSRSNHLSKENKHEN